MFAPYVDAIGNLVHRNENLPGIVDKVLELSHYLGIFF